MKIGIDKINGSFFFPLLKKGDEVFVNEEIPNCDISPESALLGIKYYQLTLAKDKKGQARISENSSAKFNNNVTEKEKLLSKVELNH